MKGLCKWLLFFAVLGGVCALLYTLLKPEQAPEYITLYDSDEEDGQGEA